MSPHRQARRFIGPMSVRDGKHTWADQTSGMGNFRVQVLGFRRARLQGSRLPRAQPPMCQPYSRYLRVMACCCFERKEDAPVPCPSGSSLTYWLTVANGRGERASAMYGKSVQTTTYDVRKIRFTTEYQPGHAVSTYVCGFRCDLARRWTCSHAFSDDVALRSFSPAARTEWHSRACH